MVRDGENGRLVDFFSTEQIAAAVDDALGRQDEYRPLREAARRTVVERFDLRRVCLPAQLGLIENLVGKEPARRVA